MNAMPIDLMFRNEKNINLMLFNEIDNLIEVYNNLVIELVQYFGTSFFGRIDHLASSVIKFRPKNSVPKHCTSSITYNYIVILKSPFSQKLKKSNFTNLTYLSVFLVYHENHILHALVTNSKNISDMCY